MSQGKRSRSSEAKGGEPGEAVSRQRPTQRPASTEKKMYAPDQGALMHRENGMRTEVSKLDCSQRPLSRDEVYKGV